MNNTFLCFIVILAGVNLGEAASPQIISAKGGDEGAIIVKWTSKPGAVYRIEYASQLVDGGTQWRTLYEDYPSHGTNTFWMDNGDYTQEPPVPRPRNNEMRFYRIAQTGTNTAAGPFVVVTSPASNAVVSGELVVSVIATSSLPVVNHRLFVDGLEMSVSDDGTNYIINTAEWANGPHTIFATAKAQSELGGLPGARPPITVGRAVSTYVPVTFDNFVSQLYFSEAFFEPDLGQTQQVTAAFSAYSAWTLQILNQESNAVRTATGAGRTMKFSWDGKGDGGVSLPNAVYEYVVTAVQTNEPPPSPPEEETPPSPPPAPGGSSAMTVYPSSPMEALKEGLTSYILPTPPRPPILKDGLWYQWEEFFGPPPPIEVQVPLRLQEAYLQSLSGDSESSTVTLPGATGGGSGSARGPTKPPVAPVKGVVGTFGVAYQTYLPNGFTTTSPRSGLPFPPSSTRIGLDGQPGNFTWTFIPVAQFKNTIDGFVKGMTSGGWKAKFIKKNDEVAIQGLYKQGFNGGSNIFNSVNIGFFASHGNYGSTLDYTSEAFQTYQTYFPIWNSANNTAEWMRLSEFDFGSSGTGGLRWMGILACNTLRNDNYVSMYNRGVLPINDDLHLLCSGSTIVSAADDLGAIWAKQMTSGGAFAPPQTVKRAWFLGGSLGYKNTTGITNTTVFRVAGWPNCFSDKLLSYAAETESPDPSYITFEDQQVWPTVPVQ